jgi:hypothetical protein
LRNLTIINAHKTQSLNNYNFKEQKVKQLHS